MTLKTNEDGQVVVKVGEEEKVLSEEDITGLIDKGAKFDEVAPVADKIRKASEKYDVDPDTYIQQAEGSFATIGKLIEGKVIDDQGNVVVEKKAPVEDPKKTKPKGELASFDTKGLVGDEKTAAVIMKALEPIAERMKTIEGRQTKMGEDFSLSRRLDLERDMKQKFDNLDEYDVSRVFGVAMNDQTKNLWEHAEAYSKDKATRVAKDRAGFAEEFGVNLEDYEKRNAMQDMSPAEGMAQVTSGKKLSFKNRRGDKDAVTPRKAMVEFFRGQKES